MRSAVAFCLHFADRLALPQAISPAAIITGSRPKGVAGVATGVPWRVVGLACVVPVTANSPSVERISRRATVLTVYILPTIVIPPTPIGPQPLPPRRNDSIKGEFR